MNPDAEEFSAGQIAGRCAEKCQAGIPADFSSKNNPIYGHNMKNGTMFANAEDYTFLDALQLENTLIPLPGSPGSIHKCASA